MGSSPAVLVGQQEAFTPQPVKRLTVPRGHTAVWGCDLGVSKLALAYVTAAGDRSVHTVPFRSGEGPSRLAMIYEDTSHAVAQLLDWGWPLPGLILTEQPSGSSQAVNLPFIQAVGVIRAGLYQGLLERRVRPEFMEVTSSWWKKRACGYGHISKPQKEKGKPKPKQTDYQVFCWSVENGFKPTSWDTADASGMAVAGIREFLLVER